MVVVSLRAESLVHGSFFPDLVSCDIVTSFQEVTTTPNYVKSIPANSLKPRKFPACRPSTPHNQALPSWRGCARCKTSLRLIAMIETEDTIKKILSAMHLPTEAPKLWPARPPPSQSGGEGGDWLN